MNLSIVVVSLNSKIDFIKTIKSIINQTYKKKEIIVIDGSSCDGTIEQIKKFKKYFRKVVIENDKGIYDAMNKGIKLSKGKWTMFLNSGDIFYRRNILDKIFKQKLSNSEILFGDTLINNKKIKYFAKAKNFTNNTIIMPFCHQSAIVRTKILKNLLFDLNYKYSSDFDFFNRCYCRKKIFYKLNHTIANVLANGLSDNNRQKVYSENIKILSKYNYSFFIIAKLWLLKLFNFIKDCIKFILPEDLILLILKFKYRKRLK